MLQGRDGGVSDVLGTLLMVGAVVLGGGILTAVITSNLATTSTPAVSLSLAPLATGDATLSLSLKAGVDLDLHAIAIVVQRGAGASEDVPRALWTTPDPTTWHVGERLSFPLAPAAAAGERVEVRIAFLETNEMLATLATSAPIPAAGLGSATLFANVTPNSTIADGVSGAKLTVLVSHRNGSANIARVTADLVNLTNASKTANTTLDLVAGAAGEWTGVIRAPGLTPIGGYNITIHATDLAGQLAGATLVRLNITGNFTHSGSGSGGGSGVGGPGDPGGGVIVNGTCYGCIVSGGVSSYEGTRLTVPTSANITRFRLNNWTWDRLDPARITDDAAVIRVVNSSHAWSMYFRFAFTGNQPCITYARAWTALNATVYSPRNGTCLSIDGLDLDLMDPVASQQFSVASGNANPNSLYKSAGIGGKPTFILAYLRDEDPTGQDELAQEIGVFSMDVVMS